MLGGGISWDTMISLLCEFCTSIRTICWSNKLDGVELDRLLKGKDDYQLLITVTLQILVGGGIEGVLKGM